MTLVIVARRSADQIIRAAFQRHDGGVVTVKLPAYFWIAGFREPAAELDGNCPSVRYVATGCGFLGPLKFDYEKQKWRISVPAAASGGQTE